MPTHYQYIELSFINDYNEIKKQIVNTIAITHLFNNGCKPTTLNFYLENTQYGYTASALPEGTYRLLRITDINAGSVNWENVPYCECSDAKKYVLNQGDILVARTGGTTGKSFLIESVPTNAIFASYLIRLRANKKCLPGFLTIFLNSYVFWSQISELKSGSAQPNVNAEKLKTLSIPECSVDTQQKIIEIINGIRETNGHFETKLKRETEEVLSKVESNEFLMRELDHQQTYLQLLRQTILQEAIQGKLTQRNLADGLAAELLKCINAEKQKLIKEGKLKREKELSPITADEIPFGLPEGWVWCRFVDVGILKRGKSKHRPRNDVKLFKDGIYPFIQTGEVSQAKRQDGLITSINGYYNEFGLQQSEMQKRGTLCITIAANIAEYGFLNFDACVPDSIVCFESIDNSVCTYASLFIDVSKRMLEEFAPSTAQKNINLGILNELKFPLPPLAQLKRIVVKVQQLQEQLSVLEAQVHQNRQYGNQLLQSVLKKAFEQKENAQLSFSIQPTVAAQPIPKIDRYTPVAEIRIVAEPAAAYKKKKEDLNADEELQLLFIVLNIARHQQDAKREATLGDVKMEKTCHLGESLLKELHFNRRPKKEEFGPADFKRLYYLQDFSAKHNIFFYDKKASYKKYTAGEQFNTYLQHATQHFHSSSHKVNSIINLFLPLDTHQMDVLATTFAAWNNLLISKQAISFTNIANEARWHERKKVFIDPEIQTAIDFLSDNNIQPKGEGKLVL